MALNFPNSPADNDIYTYGGISYRYDATKGVWVVNAPTPSMVKISSGTISSPVATISIPMSGSYPRYQLAASGLGVADFTVSNLFGVQFSLDGGATWIGDVVNLDSYITGWEQLENYIDISNYKIFDTLLLASFVLDIFPGSATIPASVTGTSNTSAPSSSTCGGAINPNPTVPITLARVTDVRIITSELAKGLASSNFNSGSWTLYGVN